LRTRVPLPGRARVAGQGRGGARWDDEVTAEKPNPALLDRPSDSCPRTRRSFPGGSHRTRGTSRCRCADPTASVFDEDGASSIGGSRCRSTRGVRGEGDDGEGAHRLRVLRRRAPVLARTRDDWGRIRRVRETPSGDAASDAVVLRVGPSCSAVSATAEFTSEMWEKAWGKLPTRRFATGCYSSDRSPTSFDEPDEAVESLTALRWRRSARSCPRARTSTRGRHPATRQPST